MPRPAHYGTGPTAGRSAFPVPSSDVDDATRLLQALTGQSLMQICASLGDVQLRFTNDLSVASESKVRTTADRAAVAPYTLDGSALLCRTSTAL